MLNRPTRNSADEPFLPKLYFALSMASLLAYVLASEGMRNLFLVTVPQIIAKVSQP